MRANYYVYRWLPHRRVWDLTDACHDRWTAEARAKALNTIGYRTRIRSCA